MHLRNRQIILILTLVATTMAASAEVWTLDSCVAYAREHNLSVRSAELQQRGSELSVTEARDAYLPSLSGSANGSLAFGRGLMANNMYENRNTGSFGWNVGLNLPLFQGLSAYRREQMARADLRRSLAQVEAARDDIELNVMTSYLQALFAMEMDGVAAEQVRISRLETDRRRELLNAGKIAEVELLQAVAQLGQDSVTLVNARNDRQLALLDLAQLLRLPAPQVDAFEVAPLENGIAERFDIETVYSNALIRNNSLRASELAIETARRQVTLAESGYLPRLNFSLGLGSSYYNSSGVDNQAFGRQMRDNYSTNLGLTLSIPIFDAFGTRNSIRRAKLSVESANLEFEVRKDAVYRAISQAYRQAQGAEQKLQASERALAAADEAFRAMQDKYNYGRANSTEYEQAKSTYIRAMSNKIQAGYELILRQRILAFYNR